MTAERRHRRSARAADPDPGAGPDPAPVPTQEVTVPLERTAPAAEAAVRSPRRRRSTRRRATAVAVVAVAVLVAACSSSGSGEGSAGSAGSAPGGTAPAGGVVRLVTHDSFAVSDEVLQAFTDETGLTVEVLRDGDAVAMVNKAILTKGNPRGDVLFGIDSNTLARGLDEGLFQRVEVAGLDRVPEDLQLDPEDRVVPVDRGDVCLNYDVAYFADQGLAPPDSLDDLTDPAYRDLTVVQNPATSTPGFAFVLATIATYGEDGGAWLDYWSDLRANGVLVVDGWEQAYLGAFSGGSGEGDRPIVVSYASSPPYEVANAGEDLTEAPTAVVESSCFQQVELAGVLNGAANPDGGRRLVEFLLSDRFQADIPEQMYVYPVVEGTPLPASFTRYATVPADPLTLPPADVAAHRDEWVEAWTSTVVR